VTVLDTLQTICYTGGDRATIATPFKMLFEDRAWAAGTDGHLLAALHYDGELRSDGPDARAIIAVEPPPEHTAQLSALREWAGLPYPSESVCPKCNGKPPYAAYYGQSERGRYCGECDSLGRKIEGIRGGKLLRGALNRMLLSRVLCTVPEGVTALRVGHSGEFAPYIFRADGWLAAVMPIRGVADDAPLFVPAALARKPTNG